MIQAPFFSTGESEGCFPECTPLEEATASPGAPEGPSEGGKAYSLWDLELETGPFDEEELRWFTEEDARKSFSQESCLQSGTEQYFIAEQLRQEPDWPGFKAERRRRLAEWALLSSWERGVARRRKTWTEKYTDFRFCSMRFRVVAHVDENSKCAYKFVVPEYCRLRGCPRCGEKLADDFYNKWIARLLGVAKYHPKGARDGKPGYEFYHLTLTLLKAEKRPSPDEMRDLWRVLLKDAGIFLRAFYPGSKGKSKLFPQLDGCGSVSQGEVGRKKDGSANWNQHVHAIVYGPWQSVKKMKAFWSELTGASGYGVQVERLENDPVTISKTLRHMFKYYRKPFADKDSETYVSTLVGMFGVRLRRSTGIFYRDQRGSDWADRVAEWESWAREELERRGLIPERELKCFGCGGLLLPDYTRGLLWRAQALNLNYEDYEKARKSRGPPSWAAGVQFSDDDWDEVCL